MLKIIPSSVCAGLLVSCTFSKSHNSGVASNQNVVVQDFMFFSHLIAVMESPIHQIGLPHNLFIKMKVDGHVCIKARVRLEYVIITHILI